MIKRIKVEEKIKIKKKGIIIALICIKNVTSPIF